MGTPVKVTIKLCTPICFKAAKTMRPLTYDALLAYWWMIDKGLCKNTSEDAPENLVDPVLPLARRGGCYAASAMFVENAAYRKDIILRKMDEGVMKDMYRFAPNDTTLTTNHGPFAAVMVPVNLLATPEINFYCYVTDMQEFVRLSKLVKQGGYVGAKHNIGFGQISGMRIDPVKEDWSYVREAVPTRPLPAREFITLVRPGTGISHATYRPPYWFQGYATDCFLPPISQWMPDNIDTDRLKADLEQKLRDMQEKMEKAL